MIIEFTPELIAGVVGAAISWIFAWFPGLRTWFAALRSEIKSAIMLALLAIATVTVYLLTFYGVLETETPITIWRLLSVFFFASTINQVTYSLTPQAKDVIEIKEAKG